MASGAVKAFRSEVSGLRNVIKNTVNDVLDERLGKSGTLKAKLASIPNLKPLQNRVNKLETWIKAVEEMAAGNKRPAPSLGPLTKRVGKLERDVADVRKGAEKGVKELAESGNLKDIMKKVAESRLSGINKKTLMFKKELEMLRGQVEDSSVKKFEEQFQRDMGSMKSQVQKVMVDSKGLEERLSSEIEDLKKGTGKSPEEKVPNMEELMRDLEIIKTKQEWIENNIERIDIKPLMMKMEELEHRIRVIGVSSPIVLE